MLEEKLGVRQRLGIHCRRGAARVIFKVSSTLALSLQNDSVQLLRCKQNPTHPPPPHIFRLPQDVQEIKLNSGLFPVHPQGYLEVGGYKAH